MDIAHYIDSTNLKPDARAVDIIRLCEEARCHRFTAVCTTPYRLPLAVSVLAGSGVRTATVISFPLGAETAKAKGEAAAMVLAMGADELDMVINIGALKDRQHHIIEEEIQTVMRLKEEYDFKLKLIVETALLDRVELADITRIISAEKADFIKTSTGFSSRGVTMEDIRQINAHKSDDLQIKASGGVKDVGFVMQLLALGVNRIGTSNAGDILRQYQAAGR